MIYELVDWPTDCLEVPTYFQLISTMELVEMVKENPSQLNPSIIKKVEKWLKQNSVEKFIEAIELAEEVQMRLDKIRQDFIDTNKTFPLKYMREDN